MIARPPPRTSRLWPGMVFALIALNFGVVAVTVYASRAAGSSFAVEPRYDQKALHWDEYVSRRAIERQLGWSVILDSVDAGRVRVRVLDRDGNPITGARVEIEAFHHARAGRRLTATLAESAQSGYEGALAVDTAGLWQFSITVRRAGDTFTTDITRAIGERNPS